MLLQSSSSSSSPPKLQDPVRHQSTSTSSGPATPRVRSGVPPRGRSWHNNVDDRLTRKLMMLRLRHLHPVLAGTKCTATTTRENAVVPSLVQRLEWMLYNAAHSMHEYTHEQSLERRVQALVTQLEPQAVTEERQRKRGAEDDVGPSRKRQCVGAAGSVGTSSADCSVFLLDNDANLVGLVLSFLSGRTVLGLRTVNCFLWENAPKMVRTLHLETHSAALRHFSSGALTSLLLSCNQLTSLVVTCNLKGSRLRAEVPARRIMSTKVRRRPSFTRPTRQGGTCNNGMLAGELLLRDIAQAFEQGACPLLQELDLGSPLDYFAESDDVLACLEAFAAGRRTVAVDTSAFRQLRLDSTYLGDTRFARLADTVEQTCGPLGVNCFGSLETLVLRSNFMGEAGCQALLRMLRHMPRLQVLDLSGNILTDLDAIALAEQIASSSKLQTLLVHDNFISPEGCSALSAAVGVTDGHRTVHGKHA